MKEAGGRGGKGKGEGKKYNSGERGEGLESTYLFFLTPLLGAPPSPSPQFTNMMKELFPSTLD